ncbi:unnamed protein product [Effrenium voratum]|nr:unnamed protein product [Effrenium voratum]
MGQLARGLALAVSLAAGAKDYMARVDPSLRTWTRSIRIAHDSFLDLELHRGQLRAFQGGQLFELPYAAARVDPDCPVNNENHLERTIVERMLQMILPWSYCWKCSSGRSCGEVQKRQGAVVQDSAQKKAEPEVCEDDNKNMVWLQGAWLHSQDMFWVSGLEPSPWVQVFCLHGLLPTLCAAGEKVLPLILCALYGRRWRFQCGAGWGEGLASESSSAPVQVAGSGMSLSGARRGVVKVRTLSPEESCHSAHIVRPFTCTFLSCPPARVCAVNELDQAGATKKS